MFLYFINNNSKGCIESFGAFFEKCGSYLTIDTVLNFFKNMDTKDQDALIQKYLKKNFQSTSISRALVIVAIADIVFVVITTLSVKGKSNNTGDSNNNNKYDEKVSP